MAYLKCHDPVRNTTRDIPLRKAIVSVGRLDGNDIVLKDPTVGATHANLLSQGDTISISAVERGVDLFINGARVQSATLSPGDRVLVGRFELELVEGFPPTDDPGSTGVSTDTMRRLVDFAAQLMREESPERLFLSLLEAVVALTGAEKGFIIVFKDGERHLAAAHNVKDEAVDLSRVSDSIIDQVIEHRRPLIVSDALSDRKFGRARSVVDLKLSSVMCVPLMFRNDLLGVLYLGNDAVTGLFTERDLSILQIWAAQASVTVHAALLLNRLKTTNRNLREQLRRSSQGDIIGSCVEMKTVFRMIRRIAPTDLSALVLGETGTGKELVAQEIHRLSARAKGPFVSINCGAIPENLLESELFGHKKGAFTGAVTDKVGKFESAHHGTLFLDEIGEMPMPLQVKLLRVLQDRVIERVGDLTPRPVDIRVIAATNKIIDDEIASSRFREDLFYRLNEITLQLPPLRDRGDDVDQLARFFLAKYADQYNSRTKGFGNDAIRAMRNYYWPGNVRQLENRVKKAVIMTDRALLNADDLEIKSSGKRDIQPLADAEEAFKLSYIREALELNNWNKAQTARDLGVDPRTIFRYIEKFDD
jgi:transcriptional regulator with GAF, ATPase, and Fis domain